MNTKIIPSLLLCLLGTQAYAGVATDGSVGAAATLAGPNYQIDATLGTQSGGNLFHSFSDFSINSGETATFSGPASVDTVISRVTGGSASNINGTIRSTIPDADLYLINPNGVIFGKDAQLDVQGAFNATTANNVQFSDGSTFSATPAATDTLTVAPLSAFGFLNDTPGSIQVTSESLSVPAGKDFNLIGGDIDISIEQSGRDGISASSGNINIVSSAGNNTVSITSGSPTLGNQAGGTINLHGNGRLTTNTGSAQNGGNINLQADTISISGAAKVNSDTRSTGNAGSITVQSKQFSMSGTTDLSTSSFSSGNAGKITVNTQTGSLTDDAFISSNTYYGSGDAGEININASKSLNIDLNGTVSSTAHRNTTGDAGNINITTSTLSMTGKGDTDGDGNPTEDSALITSDTLTGSSGKGGSVNITADSINLNNGATIAVASGGSGNAGDINITTNAKLTANQGFISSKATTADGGNINLKNAKLIDLQNSKVTASVSGGVGDGGNVTISNTGVVVLDDSHISADSAGARGGKLDLQATVVRTPISTTTARGVEQALDGEVLIANEVNPNNALNELRLDFYANEIKDPCSVAIAEDESILSIEKYIGVKSCE